MNKALNIICWIVFVVSFIAYIVNDFVDEPVYLVAAAIFLACAPRDLFTKTVKYNRHN